MNSIIIAKNFFRNCNGLNVSRHLYSSFVKANLETQSPNANHSLVKPSNKSAAVCGPLSVRTLTAKAGVAHNHSRIWSAERLLSAGLLAVIPLSLVVCNPALDYALAVALVAHIHWGVEAIVVDYVRPSIFGPIIPKLSLWALYLLSILSVGGLFYFNYTDVGLSTAIRMIAKL